MPVMGSSFSLCTWVSNTGKEKKANLQSREQDGEMMTHLGIFIRSLLPLLCHSPGGRVGEHAHGEEEGGGDGEVFHDLHEDAEAFALGGFGAGAVGAKGDVVGWGC